MRNLKVLAREKKEEKFVHIPLFFVFTLIRIFQEVFFFFLSIYIFVYFCFIWSFGAQYDLPNKILIVHLNVLSHTLTTQILRHKIYLLL